MGQRIKRTVLTATMLGLVLVALPATARAGTPGTAKGLSALQVKALSRNATQSVIVVFKNQLSSLPANATFAAMRQVALQEVQSPIVSELRQLHAADFHSYDLINALSATVSQAEESRLVANPAVAEVVANATTHLEFNTPSAQLSAEASEQGARSAQPGGSKVDDAVCQEEGIRRCGARSPSSTDDSGQQQPPECRSYRSIARDHRRRREGGLHCRGHRSSTSRTFSAPTGRT